ncbi:MAG TPA: Fe-S cluster assembly protein SufD [Bacteroidales bacterium]|nr:Fe-S cluster assembly protein SufD [Bacteroidales bacterium]
MKAEETYLNIYRQYCEVVAQHSAPLLNSKRENALTVLNENGIPDVSQEEYRHFDLHKALSYDYGMNLNRFVTKLNPHDVFCCDVPNLSTRLLFVVNDSCSKTPLKVPLPEGVLCGSLQEFAVTHADILESYYGRLSEESSDGMVALNTLFAQDGFVFYIPAGVHIDKPIQLIQVLHGNEDRMVNRRLLVIAEEGAHAQLLVCDHALSSKKFISNQVTEIFVGKNASLEFYELEMDHDDTIRVANTLVKQEDHSTLLMNGITLQNGQTRNNINVKLIGEYAQTNLSGMALADQEHVVDNNLFVEHVAPHCTSQELYKYVIDDSARGVFGGRILVRKNAQKTAAYQSNKNLCSTREARMYTKPQLEIYADDVKCSHGTATGQIDEKALFYMRSRGISETEARLLLKFAFTADVIDNIRLEPLKDRMKMLVEKRFRGELAKCDGCAANRN